MAVASSHMSHAQVLVASEQASWIQKLETHLANAGYNYTVAQTQGDALKVIEGNSIGAVIAMYSDESLELMTSLRVQNQQLLLICVVPDDIETAVATHITSLVDTILPLSTPYLENQILTLLRLHFDNHQLQAKVMDMGHEIDEQKRLTNEIELLKNAIVRNVSHELRTPLLQVKSAVALLKEEVDNDKLIQYAENAMSRLEIHVKNITMLGQTLDINPGPIILRDAVEYARRNLGRIWQRKDEADRITIDIEHNLPPINADKVGLSTVMQLLIDNALKFGNNKPVTIMGRKRDDGTVYVAVQDSGIGIAKDKRKNIFDSFYQVDSSSTRRYGGAGVGLALVKLILDHHQTSVQVDSKEGKGSTFWFTLPYIELPYVDRDED